MKFREVVLLLLVLALGGYLAYDKFDLGNKIDNGTSDNNVINNEVSKKDETKLLDISKLNNYKNSDGSYGYNKRFWSENYFISLILDGTVEVCNGTDCNKISNLTTAVDIQELSVAGSAESQKYYILLDNGDVYEYTFESLKDKKYEATKVDKVSNVEKIITFHYGKKDAGGNWGVLAITNDGQYVELAIESI